MNEKMWVNPSNAEAKAQGRKDFWKPSKTLSGWYSLENPRWALSDEYPCVRVSVIFQVFLHLFVLAKLATNSTSAAGG